MPIVQCLEKFSCTSDLSSRRRCAWNNFIGYDVKELRDKPFINFISPEDLDVATETINHIIQGNNVFDVAVSLTCKSGDTVGIQFSAVSKGDTWFWFAKKQLVDA